MENYFSSKIQATIRGTFELSLTHATLVFVTAYKIKLNRTIFA